MLQEEINAYLERELYNPVSPISQQTYPTIPSGPFDPFTLEPLDEDDF